MADAQNWRNPKTGATYRGSIGGARDAIGYGPDGLFTEPVLAEASAAPGGPGEDAFSAFKSAFRGVYGREVTQEELNNLSAMVPLLQGRPGLTRLLPVNYLLGINSSILAELRNEDLGPIIDASPNILLALPGSRLRTFDQGYINKFIENLKARGDYASNTQVQALIKELEGDTGPAPVVPGTPGAPSAPAPPAPAGSKSPAVEIPATHTWIIDAGAQQWAYDQRAAGVPWADITVPKLAEFTKARWQSRATDPKYKALYAYAQAYYTTTGRWPTDVELNRYTQKLPKVPSISPDTGDLIPKPSEDGAAGGANAVKKWELPLGPDGKPAPLPPGYEWRYGADGTPIAFDISPGEKDVFAGWYQNPTTGGWEYNPFAGAADYLQFDPKSQTAWSDVVGGFTTRTGRLPTREEARNLAATLWAGADPATRDRAARFASMNGFWPTPFELEHGASQDTDANTGGGAAGQPGLGQVPVFVPGIGVVLVQGEAMGTGGVILDPFSGIPDSVRPWVREVLNGRMTAGQVPPSMRDWVNYSIGKFKDQLPVKRPEEIPWGTPAPGSSAPPGPQANPVINPIIDSASWQDAWRQYGPGGPAPDPATLLDPGIIGKLDNRLIMRLPIPTLRTLSPAILEKLDNSVLAQLDLETLGKLSDDRLLGNNAFKGAGFSNDVLLRFSNDRLKTFPKDSLGKIVTDPQRRIDLGIDPPPAPASAPGERSTEGVTKPIPAVPAPIPAPSKAVPAAPSTVPVSIPTPPVPAAPSPVATAPVAPAATVTMPTLPKPPTWDEEGWDAYQKTIQAGQPWLG